MNEKKAILIGFLFSVSMIFFVMGISCRNPSFGITPDGGASSPSCVWTPLPSVVQLLAAASNTYVIRNSGDWASAMFPYPTSIPTPVPPVDFNQWMIVGVGALFSCNYQSEVITSVCTYSDHIEVDYGPPPAILSTPGTPGATCDYIRTGQVLAAVPQSNLPVIFNPTPTATP
jgi:hypothetical protein